MPSRYNTIRVKLSIIVGVLTVIYSIILVSYFNYKYKTTLVKAATDKSEVWAEKYAGEIKSNIEAALDISRTTSQIFYNYTKADSHIKPGRKDANAILKSLVEQNVFLLGMYTAWEPNKFDGLDSLFANTEGNHPDGHFVPYWYRNGNGEIQSEPLKDYLMEGKGDYYLIPRKTKKETVVDPISYRIGDREILLMTLVVPILNPQGDFVGITGADISTESIQALVDKANLFEGNGQLSIISNNGTVVAVSGQKILVGSKVSAVFPDIATLIKDTHRNQKVLIQKDTLKTIVPITFGNTDSPWYVIIKIPVSYLTANLATELYKLAFFSIIFLGLLIFATSITIVRLLKPIRKITRVADKVAIGDLNVWEIQSTSNEIEQLNKAFMKVIASQKQITEVCSSIASGDYSKKAIVKSTYDNLAISVNQMIDFLKSSTEADDKRKWLNEGYAGFAELIRTENDVQKLSSISINFLVKYLNANQGGIFILTNNKNEEPYLEQVACYAYDRIKFLTKKIAIGEGILGQVYLEKDTIMLTDIPDNYVNITSGLGQANPNCLIVVPLVNNEKIEGVMELASFNVFGKHEIEFIEKCAVSLAAMITNARINELTGRLLSEAQTQAEQMKMQEEEMRQNMEELIATQEEFMRKDKANSEKIHELEQQLEKFTDNKSL